MPYTPAAVQIRFVYDDSEEEADLVERVIGRDEVERYRGEIEVRGEGGCGCGLGSCQVVPVRSTGIAKQLPCGTSASGWEAAGGGRGRGVTPQRVASWCCAAASPPRPWACVVVPYI